MIISSTPYYFHLRSTQSPTYYNLSRFLKKQGWKSTVFKQRADFSEYNFQYDVPAAECLEFKHLLAQLVHQYCPQVMPVTYCINDNNWPLVLNQIADEYYQSCDSLLEQQQGQLVWILKPALLNNGQHIKIFQQLTQLKEHYLSSARLGGEHVLQRYVLQPHLLQGPQFGHKYSIRMFVVLTNYAGAFLYPNGYFNVNLLPYDDSNFTDIHPHLTNEHLNEHEANVIQIRTQQYDLFKPLYPDIKKIVAMVIGSLHHKYPDAFIKKRQSAVALFGFDFIVDHNQRVWLLEANHAPCFPVSDTHPLQNNLYSEFWQAFINSFVLPIAAQQPLDLIHYQLFEAIE